MGLAEYHALGKPLSCEMSESPYLCEFWPLNELKQINADYNVDRNAPGYFGFATSGGGEMFAIAPSGEIVNLPFIGMEPSVAITISDSWSDFESKLRPAT